MAFFVHDTGTTGKHARERRRFRRDAVCWQCGVATHDTVAAHVTRYGRRFPCLGTHTLVTTCRACNARGAKAPPFRHPTDPVAPRLGCTLRWTC